MKPRFVSRLQGKYEAAQYDGNFSGVTPLGTKVLVRMDEFLPVSTGGVHFIPEQIQRANDGAESGVIIAVGPEAFHHHSDGSLWRSQKPVPGDHVYFGKFSGLWVMGNDAKRYQLMDDACIGATYIAYPSENAVDEGRDNAQE